MTKKTAENDTVAPKTPLATAFEVRDAACAALARIDQTIAQLGRTYEANRTLLGELSAKLGAASASVLLDGGDQATVDALAEQQRVAVAADLRDAATVKALVARRAAVAEAVKEARLSIAEELSAISWPTWDEYSKEAIDHFSRFLDCVRLRCQLAATVTATYRSAGETREPFNEESVERAKFLGEFGLTAEGLADLVPKAQLKLTQTGLGFLPTGSIQLLSESDLLALAEAAETEATE
jgi:hypothetical protein